MDSTTVESIGSVRPSAEEARQASRAASLVHDLVEPVLVVLTLRRRGPFIPAVTERLEGRDGREGEGELRVKRVPRF